MPSFRLSWSHLLLSLSLVLIGVITQANGNTLIIETTEFTTAGSLITTKYAIEFVPVFFPDGKQPNGTWTKVNVVHQNASWELQNDAFVFVDTYANPVDTIFEFLSPGIQGIIIHNKANQNVFGQEVSNVKVEPGYKTVIHVPFVSIGPSDGNLMQNLTSVLNQTVSATLTINGDELNPWLQIYPNYWIVHILLAVGSLAGVGLASWRVAQFVQARLFNIGFVCAVLLVLSFIFKFFAAGLDPRGNFHFLPNNFRLWFASFHMPFGLSCALLVALYWHETLSETGISINHFLGRLRIPFLVIVGLLFALELIFTILRVVGTKVLTVNVIIYVIFAVAIGIFYLVSGIRILNAIKSGYATSRKRVVIETRRRTISLMICVFGYYLFVIGALLISSPVLGFEGRPDGMAVAMSIYLGGAIISDLALATSIIPPSKDEISSTRKSMSKSSSGSSVRSSKDITTTTANTTRTTFTS